MTEWIVVPTSSWRSM